MTRFPVLVCKGRRAQATFFTLRARPRNAFVAGDDLALTLEEPEALLEFFFLTARRFFPGALSWQADWPAEEQAALAVSLGLRPPWRLSGDSWLLPLFFAMACREWSRPWPEGVLASGAIRQCRGQRCASIGGAAQKLGRARSSGGICLLPQSNVRQLRGRGADVSRCVALPFNLDRCLSIWSQYVRV